MPKNKQCPYCKRLLPGDRARKKHISDKKANNDPIHLGADGPAQPKGYGVRLCSYCSRTFYSEKALQEHLRAKREDKCEKHMGPRLREREHLKNLEAGTRVQLLDMIAGDWSDGAYWAYAEELGVGPEDMV